MAATTARSACPLCRGRLRRPWRRWLRYENRDFRYLQCDWCGSGVCDPMPDAQMLSRMYGPSYRLDEPTQVAVGHPGQGQEFVIRWLKQLPRATFMDYGCGAGSLLLEARDLGWQVVGVELEASQAEAVMRSTGVRVETVEQARLLPRAQVIHLGDVIEHLTNPDIQLLEILSLLEPGGLLLAQGPLEAGPSLFSTLVHWSWRLRPHHVVSMPPYHVVQASVTGQRAFFAGVGLTQLEYTVTEEAWPAPSSLTLADLAKPKAMALFAIRRLSMCMSALSPRRWGNRYSYAGRFAVSSTVSDPERPE